MEYNREYELKERFNDFLYKVTGRDDDYYTRLSIEDFEDLKTALKDIHNIITYRTTIKFVDWLKENFKMNESEYERLIDRVIHTKPNDNGYDIQLEGSHNIIAEVKCNKPINQGTVFGSAQRNGIEKDLEALLAGKSKAKNLNYNDYYKFMVIYEFGNEVRQAVKHLMKNLKSDLKDKVEVYTSTKNIEKGKVYIVFINEKGTV